MNKEHISALLEELDKRSCGGHPDGKREDRLLIRAADCIRILQIEAEKGKTEGFAAGMGYAAAICDHHENCLTHRANARNASGTGLYRQITNILTGRATEARSLASTIRADITVLRGNDG